MLVVGEKCHQTFFYKEVKGGVKSKRNRRQTAYNAVVGLKGVRFHDMRGNSFVRKEDFGNLRLGGALRDGLKVPYSLKGCKRNWGRCTQGEPVCNLIVLEALTNNDRKKPGGERVPEIGKE